MLLLRGATRTKRQNMTSITFQYMLLLRGATKAIKKPLFCRKVSIHAPLARSNAIAGVALEPGQTVSIHAPLARSN